jgi:hypothetical protein
MIDKIQKCDEMIWSIRRRKLTGRCQSTQGETGPIIVFSTTNPSGVARDKNVSPREGDGDQPRVKALP